MEERTPTHRPTPRRHWFRFRLRTMFVLVTLFSIYLGWALDWKRQRHEFLKAENVHAHNFEDLSPTSPNPHTPLALWPVWEKGYEFLTFDSPSVEQWNEGARLFPEATLLH